MVQVKSKVAPKEAVQEAPKKVPATKEKRVYLAHGVGRRKSSVARAWLHRGTGKVTIKGQDIREYFDTELDYNNAVTPLRVIPSCSKYNARVTISGGGKVAQSDAIKLAISRSILAFDESLRVALREHDLLTVDARVKERKKYGRKAARRGFQFVKR